MVLGSPQAGAADSVRAMQINVERYDVFLTPEVDASLPGGAGEVSLWRTGARGAPPKQHPLSLYGTRSVGAIKLGKGLVNPERIAAYEARALPRTFSGSALQPMEVLSGSVSGPV